MKTTPHLPSSKQRKKERKKERAGPPCFFSLLFLSDHPPRRADETDDDDGREDTCAGAIAGADGLERGEGVPITCEVKTWSVRTLSLSPFLSLPLPFSLSLARVYECE
jgi:hypothetical protein